LSVQEEKPKRSKKARGSKEKEDLRLAGTRIIDDIEDEPEVLFS